MTSSSRRSAAPILISAAAVSSSGRYPLSCSSYRPRPSSLGGRSPCMCSPTTHPGSFRCSLHKGLPASQAAAAGAGSASASQSIRPDALRSAGANSLVRRGAAEGAVVLPSSHQHRRRLDFRPRPTRLSIMSKGVDVC